MAASYGFHPLGTYRGAQVMVTPPSTARKGARGVAGGVGVEGDDGLCDVVGGGGVSEGCLLRDGVEHLSLVFAGVGVGSHQAGSDGVDPDTVGGEFSGEEPGVADTAR